MEKNENDKSTEKEKKIDYKMDITPEDVQLMQAMGIPFVI